MLPVFGRPLKAKPDTQSSEHGLVATKDHYRFNSSSSVERNVLFLGDPDAVKQHGKIVGLTLRIEEWLGDEEEGV